MAGVLHRVEYLFDCAGHLRLDYRAAAALSDPGKPPHLEDGSIGTGQDHRAIGNDDLGIGFLRCAPRASAAKLRSHDTLKRGHAADEVVQAL